MRAVSITDLEARVLTAIDDAAVVSDLRTLVETPSVVGTDAEHDVQSWMAERLKSLGLEVDHWRIDVGAAALHDDFPGMEVERSEAYGVVGVSDSREAGTPALILNGHVDVVPPGDLSSWPFGDPFVLKSEGSTLRGRGTCDMKAGVAAILGALQALQTSGVQLRRPLAVHSVIGEEDGGLGAYATLARGYTGDRCVIAEPTSSAIVPANGGSLTFRLEVPGLATHGSTRTRGVNAVEKLGVIWDALRTLETERNRDRDPLMAHLDIAYPLSIGIIRAGDWASTVPDLAVAQGRYGVRLGESVHDARVAFEEAVALACAADPWLREHPVRVSWPGGVFASGRLPEGHPLLSEVGLAVADLGAGIPDSVGAPYGSDLRQYAAAGIATLHYGPGDARYAHAVDEQVEVQEIARCTRAYALLAMRSCGVV
jgi:acetylornithine deacetylase